MTTLAQALECFNRKERNLLIRSVLGHREKPLQLSLSFWQEISAKLNIAPIPEPTWWATDYHMSWMAGALAVHLNDAQALNGGRCNPELKGCRLVEGNQEDIDLLIAAGQHLIMVEAKAYGSWTHTQLDSKLKRLDMLLDYYEKIKSEQPPIFFHLVLTSPKDPKETSTLDEKLRGCSSRLWSDHCWIRLEVERTVREVTRCQPNGISSSTGEHWCVVTKNYTFGKKASGQQKPVDLTRR